MLTIPNTSTEFKKLRRFVKKSDVSAFVKVINNFLHKVHKRKLNKAGFQPCIIMKQRRYRTMREVSAVDGALTFDLGTLEGLPTDGKTPAIHAQPEWTSFCYQLLRDKNSNIQFQIGMYFNYGHVTDLDQPSSINYFKDALRATTIFLKAI